MNGMRPRAPSGHRLALLLAGGVVVFWAGLMALLLGQAQLPAAAGGLVLAAFPPGTPADQALAAIVRADGEPVRPVWPGFVWVAHGSDGGFVARLKEEGALAAFGELSLVPVLGGCAVVAADEPRLSS